VIEIKIPGSVADASIVAWRKTEGNNVRRGELLVEIETAKSLIELTASHDGVLGRIIEHEGMDVVANQIIGSVRAAP